MRKLTTLMYFFMAAALFLTSCGDDKKEDDPTVQKPTITFTSASPIQSDVNKYANDTLTFVLDLRQGAANLKTLTILEGAGSNTPSAIDAAKYTITTADKKTVKIQADGNYDEKDNAVLTVKVFPKGNAGTYTYVFGLTDKDDVSATALEVTVNVVNVFRTYTNQMLQGNTASTSGDILGQFFSSTTGHYGGSGSWTGNNKPSDIDITYESTATLAKFYSPSTKPLKGTLTGLTVTKYAVTTLDYATATKVEIMAATAPTATDVDVVSGTTYLIMNAAGQRGLIKVTALKAGATGEVTFDVKVLN